MRQNELIRREEESQLIEHEAASQMGRLKPLKMLTKGNQARNGFKKAGITI